jgi:hypothetical protein
VDVSGNQRLSDETEVQGFGDFDSAYAVINKNPTS